MEFDHFSCDELSSTSGEEELVGGSSDYRVVSGGNSQPVGMLSPTDGPREGSAHDSADGEMDDEIDDLYGDIDCAPQLPSNLTMRRTLASVLSEREELEVQVARLSGEISEAKACLQQSLRNAYTILCTARLEIQRKETQVADARARVSARRRREEHSCSGVCEVQTSSSMACAEGTGCFSYKIGPVVDGVGARRVEDASRGQT
eukprot:scaffold158805_cov34-Tisochrysis_lutea.AAC.1